MKNLILAAAVAATAAFALAAPSEAGSRRHNDKHSYHQNYKYFVYDYDQYYDEEYCYTKKVRKHGYWKKITICE